MATGIQNQQSNLRHVAVYGKHNGKSTRWELTIDENNPKDIEALQIACLHPPKKRFNKYNPFPNVTLGDHNTDTVKIDLDGMSIIDVKHICFMLMKRYSLEGFIILQSSSSTRLTKDEELLKTVYKYRMKSFHVVFNRSVSMVELNRILAWLCLRLKNESLTKWFFMQLQKGTFTLRIGFKGKKKRPRIVFRYGCQDKQIKQFLLNRKFILGFLEVKCI